jgi:hypothetical protein
MDPSSRRMSKPVGMIFYSSSGRLTLLELNHLRASRKIWTIAPSLQDQEECDAEAQCVWDQG